MAARAIPFTAQYITIDSGFVPSPLGDFNQGQDVTFTNNSGATIDIKFAPNPITPTVFTDILGLSPTAPNNTATRTPQVTNGSVNYYVWSGGVQKSGPYPIQVGTGPMFVQITNSIATPEEVAIPHTAVGGGTLQMVSTDVPYDIGPPSFSNMFNKPLTKADNTSHTNIGSVGSFDYTITASAPGRAMGGGKVGVMGGGRVIIHPS